MSLQSVIVGALPDLEVQPVIAATKERPAPGRTKRRMAEWSAERIAERIGIHPTTLYRYVRQYDELRRILGVTSLGTPGAYANATSEGVEKAAAFIFALPYWGAWSRRHPHCCRCGKTDSRHHGRGVCVRCFGREAWQRKGGSNYPFPDAWDRIRGHERCTVCRRDDRPHKSGGRCLPCDMWWRYNRIGEMSKTNRQRLSASRRRVLRSTGGGRNGKGVPSIDGRKKNGRKPQGETNGRRK